MERLKISKNKRYLITESGKPFSWLADTVWTMPQRLRWCDAAYLIRRRKEQGFNALQICALDPERDVGMHTPAGEPALIDGDLNRPNECYFEYLDRILDEAERNEMYVLLLPVWGQLVVGDDWGGGKYDIVVNENNAYGYGQWIGARYRDRNNILWCLGGDRMPIHKGVDYRNVWRRMAEGLANGLTGQELRYNESSPIWDELMITYHACHEMETGLCSTFSYWDDTEQWIRFIMLQSGHGADAKNYELIRQEYDRPRTMPVWDGEPAYELMPSAWPDGTEIPRHGAWMVRRRAYWSLLAGGFGFTYGHASVWCSVYEQEKNFLGPVTWQEALDSEGANQMRYVRAFMDATESMTCSPCQEIFSELERREGNLLTHAQAARSVDGDKICVYLPSGGRASLNLRNLWGRDAVGVWYWSPRDGRFYAGKADVHLTEKEITVSAPTEGEGQDWLVILTDPESEKPIPDLEPPTKAEQEKAKKVFAW